MINLKKLTSNSTKGRSAPAWPAGRFGGNKQLTTVVVFLLVITAVYLVTRFINLTNLPVFADEAIYIRWAQVMRSEPSLRFLPLSDGKQPLFMWLVIPALKLFSDPLFAGRIMSVGSGLLGMLGIGTLSWLLYKNRNITKFSCLLYIITPIIFFFNRMSLPDNQLMMAFIWALNFFILSAQTLRLDTAMIAGIAVGAAWLTKSPAIMLIILMPSTLLLFDFHKKGLSFRTGKLFGFWLIVIAFGFAIYNILRLGPEFHMIAARNKDYIFSIAEILKHPFNPLIGNLKSVMNWFWIWLTPPIFLLGIFGAIVLYLKKRRETLFLLIWFLVPLLAQSAIAKVYTARYILFIVPFLLVASAGGLNYFFTHLKSKAITILLLVLILFLPVYESLWLIVDPARSWIPQNERQGYLEMWTAGQGIKQTADYLKQVALTQKVLVGTEGYFGTLPDGLQIYLNKVPNTTVIGVGWPIKEISDKLTSGLVDSRVFLVANENRIELTDYSQLKLINAYPKAVNKLGKIEHLMFYEIVDSKN